MNPLVVRAYPPFLCLCRLPLSACEGGAADISTTSAFHQLVLGISVASTYRRILRALGSACCLFRVPCPVSCVPCSACLSCFLYTRSLFSSYS